MSLPTSLSEAIEGFLYGFDIAKPLIPTYTHLLISALFCIYVGAHASLSRPSSTAIPPKKKCKRCTEHSEDEDDTDDEGGILQKMEGFDPSDAIMLPIMSGLTLGGLYLLLKHFDPAVLNKVLNWYFAHAGFIFTTAFIKDGFSVIRSFVFPELYTSRGSAWKANQEKRIFIEIIRDKGSMAAPRTRVSPLPGFLGILYLPGCLRSSLWHIRGLVYQKATLRAHIRSVFSARTRFTILDVLSVVVALCVVGYSAFVARPWWLINFLGFGFSYGALQFLSPTTFATGSLILGSLFFYDIYFVFYTPMMVTVAQKLDLPIKLLFPRPPTKEDPSAIALAMLGLGDIVVPGTMIGLALRFDLYLHYLRKHSTLTGTGADADSRPKYVTATGGWGERFWSSIKSALRLPDKESSYFEAKAFRKTYFKAGMAGYMLGMLATLVAMQLSNHPQPALLYLVPGVLSSIWLTALVKGDIPVMWNFSDGLDDEEGKDSKKDKKDNGQDRPKASFAGLFKQLIFGEPKSETDKAKVKDGQGEGEATNKCAKTAEEDNTSPSIDLVSFSISVPRKKTRQSHSANLDPKTFTQSVSPRFESSGISSSSALVEDVGEAPPKKRRTQ
ncbi:signal peptide peptidase [Coccidioides immitis RS]|uniref:Signal peptide peptidase n=1 Tax=Coccidioides immitis (strain RS) TaxID=246410 RepID=A0A0E1RVN7_COCIM|nr:signal peptide peptidase [Coccidioides immitis RS]EAS30344.1 signal peptide peptidase [Coccidioides immitis RS]